MFTQCRSGMTMDSRNPTMPEWSMSGFHRLGREESAIGRGMGADTLAARHSPLTTHPCRDGEEGGETERRGNHCREWPWSSHRRRSYPYDVGKLNVECSSTGRTNLLHARNAVTCLASRKKGELNLTNLTACEADAPAS